MSLRRGDMHEFRRVENFSRVASGRSDAKYNPLVLWNYPTQYLYRFSDTMVGTKYGFWRKIRKSTVLLVQAVIRPLF